MLRRALCLVGLLFAAALIPGCAHFDPDQNAVAVAHHFADLPRDVVTQDTLNTPRVKQLPAPDQQSQHVKLPTDLPGADARPLVLPDLKDLPTAEQKEKAVAAAFPELPRLDSDPVPGPGPTGVPLDLPALQALALANNPTVQQAATDVQAARGGMIQAGLYPNPSVGYQGDEIGSGKTAGQQGGYIEQTIKTGGKLKLARAVAEADLRNAEVALRKVTSDVISQVRSGYFAVLVAQENLAIARAMSILTDDSYHLLLKQVAAGQAALYEPLQLHVLAVQARSNVVQAHNRYLSAWKQLAAVLGQPDLPPTLLAGRADAMVPGYAFEEILAYVRAHHTDVVTAEIGIEKTRRNLELQRVQPIPDIVSHVAVQKDMTGSPPHEVQVDVQLGVALPVFDRNQGNILTAQAQLAHANREVARVQNDLSSRLAEAFERYRNNVTQVAFYQSSILPNQVRVYRALYQRYHTEPAKVQFSDLVLAEQTLAQVLTVYVQSLVGQWQAVVDLGALLQTDDLYQVAGAAPCQPPPQPVSQMLDASTWTYPGTETRPARATLARPTFGP